MTIRTTVASMPSPRPVLPVVRGCGPSTQHGEEVKVEDPLAHAVDCAPCRERSSPSRASGATISPAGPIARSAVAELRRRKHRDEKPLAVMVADPRAANELCEIGPGEHALLVSLRRPIVLLRRRPGAPVADQVAPGNPFLGVFLPYSPLHHLLLRDIRYSAGDDQRQPVRRADRL